MVVLQALFLYLPAVVVLERRGLRGALAALPRTWARGFWAGLVLGAVALLPLLPFDALSQRVDLLVERGAPELVVWLTAAAARSPAWPCRSCWRAARRSSTSARWPRRRTSDERALRAGGAGRLALLAALALGLAGCGDDGLSARWSAERGAWLARRAVERDRAQPATWRRRGTGSAPPRRAGP